MVSAVYVVVVCLCVCVCVCLSVCLSVTLWYCIKMAKCRIAQIMPHDSCGTRVRFVQHVALLWQRDRATRLSVEILQLQNIPLEN